MRLLVVRNGAYGERHSANLRAQAPADWEIRDWRAPPVLPPVIDDPEEFVPANLPAAELILSVAEHRGVAELLPDLARVTMARAVVVGVDREEWLPQGLARQLHGWLADMGVACATPKPLCTLTETDYAEGRGRRVEYDSRWISEFARCFGRPELQIIIDPDTRRVTAVSVERDAVCGCAHHVAQGLVGISADDAAEKAGLLHAHYPCLAGMEIDAAYDDTLLHISGHLTKDHVADQVKPFTRVVYLDPGRSGGSVPDPGPAPGS